MATMKHLRTWAAIHKWSSLACTLFLLVICLTGLPLIFSEEIGHWLDDDPPYATLPTGTPTASLDGMVSESQRRYPGQIVTFIFVDDDEPQVVVGMAPSWQSFEDEPRRNHTLKFDARTAQLLKESDPPERSHMRFMQIMLKLHSDLFADLPGELFLGFMGLLFVVAVVSGVVLYGPFMKKLDFGTVRTGRATRLRWLDLHNLLGIVTLAWALVVGATGAMNELSTPLFALWQRTDVQAMLAPWRGKPLPPQTEWASLDTAFASARQALPGMTVISTAFPGSPFGSPHHYLLWAKGETPLTSRLFSPVLVDARTGELTAVVRMPWYLRALEVSRPLHFGDYGGLPLKIIWALLDLITIVVLGSGLYLWLARRKTHADRVAQMARMAQARP
ncbi:MAG: PepSY-associated TM helix domain-containing protein [Acidovorax sp.]